MLTSQVTSRASQVTSRASQVTSQRREALLLLPRAGSREVPTQSQLPNFPIFPTPPDKRLYSHYLEIREAREAREVNPQTLATAIGIKTEASPSLPLTIRVRQKYPTWLLPPHPA